MARQKLTLRPGLKHRAVLLGDACHPSLVSSNDIGSAQSKPLILQLHSGCNVVAAVEDGFVLGSLFSYLSNPRQIPLLLNAYQEIRQPQVAHLQAVEYASCMTFILPPGPARDARDAAFAVTLNSDEEMGDETLAQLWAGYSRSYTYDTLEAVEDWWSKVSDLVCLGF